MNEEELQAHIQSIAGVEKGLQAMALAVALAECCRRDGLTRVEMGGNDFKVVVSIKKGRTR